MRHKKTQSTLLFVFLLLLPFAIQAEGPGTPKQSATEKQPIHNKGEVLYHLSFKKPMTSHEQAALETLLKDWNNLSNLEQFDKNWKAPAFRRKIQFSSIAVDLNQDDIDEVFIRLSSDDKALMMCGTTNCFTFFMQMKNGRWEYEKDRDSLNMMLADTIDVVNHYNHGYADFFTDTFAPGKKFHYVYNGYSYYPDIIDVEKVNLQKEEVKELPTEEKEIPGTAKVLHHLTLTEGTTAASQAAVTAFLEDWSNLIMGQLEDNWNDPTFRAKVKITSAAADLNRDNIQEVFVRLDTNDEDSMVCSTFQWVTTCQTYIMQFRNGRWQRMSDIPIMSIAKINVLDSYHHGNADLSMPGVTYNYDGTNYKQNELDLETIKVVYDEKTEKVIQARLDVDEPLQERGIKFRVVGVSNGIVFLDMYLGNQNIRKAIYTDGDFDFMRHSSSSFNEQDKEDLRICRKSLAALAEMDEIQLVQIKPGPGNGTIRLQDGATVNQITSPSGKKTDDLGFTIRYDRLYLDETGLPRVDLVIEEKNKTATKATIGPFMPLIYNNMVYYLEKIYLRDKLLLTIENQKTGQKFSANIAVRKKIDWKEDGSSVGILNLKKVGKQIKEAKIWFSAAKDNPFWIKMGNEKVVESEEYSYNFFARQLSDPIITVYFDNRVQNP